MNTQTQSQPMIFKSQPVDHAAITAKHERQRKAIFALGCYSTDMKFTLDSVARTLNIPRHTCWTRIQELKRQGLVRILNETTDRKVTYQINVEVK